LRILVVTLGFDRIRLISPGVPGAIERTPKIIMNDFAFCTKTHFVRVRVVESARGYPGYVYLRRCVFVPHR
jgi:hypothetical protein